MKKFILIAACMLCALTASAMALRVSESAPDVFQGDDAYVDKNTDGSEKNLTSSKKTVHYQGEVNLGYSVTDKVAYKNGSKWTKSDSPFSQVVFSTIHGVNFYDFFMGIGANVTYAYDQDWDTWFLPIYYNFKVFYPFNDRLSVYLTISPGYNTVLSSALYSFNSRLKGGYYGEYGLGMKYRKLNVALLFEQQHMKYGVKGTSRYEYTDYRGFSFFVRVGVMF